MGSRRIAAISRWLVLAVLLAVHPATRAASDLAREIAPGQFDEHCLRIDAGQAIRWRFVSSATVDFNIHHHRGKEVHYPVRRLGVQRASGSFRSTASEDYCLMWTNTGTEAVSVRGSVVPYR